MKTKSKKTMKLISMTDFVSDILDYTHESRSYQRGLLLLQNYMEFLKQPLKLEMFMPCHEEGNVLKKPNEKAYTIEESNKYKRDLFAYLEAKEKVLFEGCSMFNKHFIAYGKGNLFHVEHLNTTHIEFFADGTLKLTPSAINQIGLTETQQ